MNPLLEQTKQALLQKVDQRLLPVVEKVAEAGKKVMYSEETRDMAMQELKRATDPESIGSAVAKLAIVLLNQSKGTIPMEVLMPAATLLLIEALGFLEEAGSVQVDNDLLAESTQALGSAFLQALGVTPGKLDGMLAKGGAGPAGAAGGAGAAQPPPQPAPPPQDAGIISGAMQGGA